VRSGVRALAVTPTAAGRASAILLEVDALWTELVAKAPTADTPSMRNQLVCHAEFAAAKDAWYLEPGRPDVGYPATVAAACNPGTVRDPDVRLAGASPPRRLP